MTRERDLPTFLFDPEVNRAINDALPEVVVDALEVATRLGDGATLVAVAILLYWFGAERDRHRRAMVLAVAVTTFALVAGLKGIFEIQRPLYAASPPLEFAPDDYPGWSTPSAHATGAAAVYGALAAVMDVGKRWQRYAVAAILIVVVSFSRVVIGVHYVGDVVIGASLGLLLVAVALRITVRSVTPMFGLSLAVAIAAFLLGSEEFTTMAIGTSLGGVVTWMYVEDRKADPLGASVLLVGLLVLGLLAVVSALGALVDIEGGFVIADTVPLHPLAIVEIVGFAVAFGGAIAVPYVAVRFDDTRIARGLQTILPFSGRTVEPDAIGQRPDADEDTDR